MADLLTLATAKKQLNIPVSETRDDEELQDFVDATIERVEKICGPCSVQTFTEVKQAATVLTLNHRPVVEVLSVIPRIPGYAPVDVTTLLPVDENTGIVELATPGYGFLTAVTVVYTAGRTDVPKSLQLAARIIVQHLWKTQRAAAPNRPSNSDDTQMLMGYAIPNRAVDMMQPYMLAAAAA